MEYKEVRKLTVTGQYNTYSITLPKKMVRMLNWKKGEKKIIRHEGKRIIIEDWAPE